MTHNQISQALRHHWQELADLTDVISLLGWDQSTFLPEGAAEDRSRQIAFLSGLKHAKTTDPQYGQQLEQALQADPEDSTLRRMLQLAHKEHERATRLPAEFVREWSEHGGDSYNAWTRARPDNDFERMIPFLEKSLELSQKAAEYFPEYETALDYYIDASDEGMTSEQIDQIFADLREVLVPLVAEIGEKQVPKHDFLTQYFDEIAQLRFGESVIADYGYSFAYGRQDLTHHPFMTRLGNHDVRITTRVKENDFSEALYSTLHEAGHALYEQGIAEDFLGTPLGRGVSSGVHESQSRLWENLVGRSRAFCEAYHPRLLEYFPQLQGVSAEDFYHAVNVVRPSLIRTDADEVTYNLHVIIRYELERDLLNGKLAVKDLADAWHAAYERTLGLRAPSHVDGVLQDVHWYFGQIGGVFQGYTVGNVLSAQFYAAAEKAIPDLEAQIARAEFAALHGWLRENIYQWGSLYTPAELVQQATGEALSAQPYLDYLTRKYRALYGLA